MEWILFYYNSLPDLPPSCPFFSGHIMHRDFLKCNPKNTGHYLYPKFETKSYDEGCHKKEVSKFLKKNDSDKYVIFYTRHTKADGKSCNKIIGYFKVGKQTRSPIGFEASESVLLSRNEAIPILYEKRGVPTSWGKSHIRHQIDSIFQGLLSKKYQDYSTEYQQATVKIMSILKSNAERKKMLGICENCADRALCYWGRNPILKREKWLIKLYGRTNTC